MAYIDRATRSHQQQLLEEQQDTPWTAPDWVYNVTLLSPYLACAVSMICGIFLYMNYATVFDRLSATYWYYSTIIGLALCLLILEMIRAAVTTVVELRKFEIRRRMAGGDFLKSRVRKAQLDKGNPDTTLKTKPPPPKKAAVPTTAIKVANPPKPPLGKPPLAKRSPDGPSWRHGGQLLNRVNSNVS